MSISSKCMLEINGERQVEGTVQFKVSSGRCSMELDCTAEFPTPLVCWLEPNQSQELCDFFSTPSIQFWKLVILDHNTNIDTMLIVSFSREPELTLHMSIAAGLESRHFEISLSNIYLELEAFFSEKKEELP